MCQQCETGYLLLNGGCTLQNCQIWDHGKCQVCDTSFQVVNGKCVQLSIV